MIRRQLCRTLQRLFVYKPLPLVKFPQYHFSTPAGKKILDVWDLNKAQYVELTDALGAAHTCRMIGELLKENIHQMTDYQLSYAIFQIYENDIELDENFYGVILPIVKEFVKNFDRNHNKSLAELISHLGWMKVEDEGLWRLFEQKLLQEKLYRYIPLRELCEVIHGFATVNQGSQELFSVFERVLVKQRLNLLPADIDYAREAFQTRQFGSQLLLDVLEDPVKPLPEAATREKLKLGEN